MSKNKIHWGQSLYLLLCLWQYKYDIVRVPNHIYGQHIFFFHLQVNFCYFAIIAFILGNFYWKIQKYNTKIRLFHNKPIDQWARLLHRALIVANMASYLLAHIDCPLAQPAYNIGGTEESNLDSGWNVRLEAC
jgi:hypothetical protein